MGLPFEERFETLAVFDCADEAQKVIDAVRESHPLEAGWQEIDAGVSLHSNGKWSAWRHHRHVR